MGFTKKEMEDQGFTSEQIAWAMAERGKEKESDKAEFEKLKTSLSDKESSIQELTNQIKSFDGKDETLKTLQEKVTTYEKAESDRIELEKQNQAQAELKNRFMAVVGENKFKHADIENGRFAAFKELLGKEEFKGKGDSDIFAEITKEMDCFVNPQQQTIVMPGGNGAVNTLTGVEAEFIKRNPNIKL